MRYLSGKGEYYKITSMHLTTCSNFPSIAWYTCTTFFIISLLFCHLKINLCEEGNLWPCCIILCLYWHMEDILLMIINEINLVLRGLSEIIIPHSGDDWIGSRTLDYCKLSSAWRPVQHAMLQKQGCSPLLDASLLGT